MSFHYLLSIVYHTGNIDDRIGSSTQIIHGNGPLDALTNWITRDRTSEEPAPRVFTLKAAQIHEKKITNKLTLHFKHLTSSGDNIAVSIKIEPIELPDHVRIAHGPSTKPD